MTENLKYRFIQRDEASKSLESLIDSNNLEKSILYSVTSFDPSRITECPRRIIYVVNGVVSPSHYKSYLEIMDRVFSKQKWMEIFSKSKGIKVVEKNVVSADCHYNISGNIDAILNMGGKLYVLKTQRIDAEQFSQIESKGAFKKHVIELMIYLWLTEVNDGMLLYDNVNQYRVFHIKYYSPVIQSITSKCLKLIDYKMKGEIPDRPYKNEKSLECVQCEFRKTCWREK